MRRKYKRKRTRRRKPMSQEREKTKRAESREQRERGGVCQSVRFGLVRASKRRPRQTGPPRTGPFDPMETSQPNKDRIKQYGYLTFGQRDGQVQSTAPDSSVKAWMYCTYLDLPPCYRRHYVLRKQGTTCGALRPFAFTLLARKPAKGQRAKGAGGKTWREMDGDSQIMACGFVCGCSSRRRLSRTQAKPNCCRARTSHRPAAVGQPWI
ncbi:hypothetical protein BGZ61DRAFT_22206 [Ilyonectria robusta]|uniref:uncharacterized protein n=1 Tax=Ilyonectria robusta TaxID=1079257 RepID=UPI001E8DD220|nr:uncharacterized protein BGZ61DRAFT_22206 [Ilyonectria robusta]KAH8737760.1 hypothetical protein BGZ61DRAFT_22206 [Ilyonectria robusta]